MGEKTRRVCTLSTEIIFDHGSDAIRLAAFKIVTAHLLERASAGHHAHGDVLTHELHACVDARRREIGITHREFAQATSAVRDAGARLAHEHGAVREPP